MSSVAAPSSPADDAHAASEPANSETANRRCAVEFVMRDLSGVKRKAKWIDWPLPEGPMR
jgi:hypothetical protein